MCIFDMTAGDYNTLSTARVKRDTYMYIATHVGDSEAHADRENATEA